MLTKLRRACFFATFFILSNATAMAQIDTGAIVGTVRDPSGAAVPKATIAGTNTATGVAVTTETNSSGEYQVTALIPGTYSVKVSSPGFASQINNGVEIHVQSRPSIDFNLKIGEVSNTIDVGASTPILQTETANVGGVISGQQIVDLPLNGRRYADLALLEAVVPQNLTHQNNTAPARFTANS